jgi:hypothetical protein
LYDDVGGLTGEANAGHDGQVLNRIGKHSGVIGVDSDFDITPAIPEKIQACDVIGMAVGKDHGNGIQVVFLNKIDHGLSRKTRIYNHTVSGPDGCPDHIAVCLKVTENKSVYFHFHLRVKAASIPQTTLAGPQKNIPKNLMPACHNQRNSLQCPFLYSFHSGIALC